MTVVVVMALSGSVHVNVRVSMYDSVLPDVGDSSAVTGSLSVWGRGSQRAAFPWYICKGRSYTYFFIDNKENHSF